MSRENAKRPHSLPSFRPAKSQGKDGFGSARVVPLAFAGFVDGIIMEEKGTSRWAAVGGGGCSVAGRMSLREQILRIVALRYWLFQ